jgi:hypothetical protein
MQRRTKEKQRAQVEETTTFHIPILLGALTTQGGAEYESLVGLLEEKFDEVLSPHGL